MIASSAPQPVSAPEFGSSANVLGADTNALPARMTFLTGTPGSARSLAAWSRGSLRPGGIHPGRLDHVPSQNLDRWQVVDLAALIRRQSQLMITLLLHLFRLLPVLCGSHRHLALENLAFRHQLAVYKQTLRRPKLHPSDRLLWVCLSRVWAEWRLALVMVTPDTVLRWHRRRFRDYWATLSSRPLVGRPSVNAEIIALVRKIAAANPLWGAPRIHGELLKLGIEVAERTVSRLIVKRRTPPSQTWRTFLTNHVQDLVSIDFFTVPTAQLRVLFVLVVLAHLGAGSFTSTSPSIPPPRGLLSRSWTPFPTTPPLPISSAIATRSTVRRSASA